MSEIKTSVRLSDKGLDLTGELTFSTASSLLAKGSSLLDKITVNPLLINLDKVSRLDSAGIALLLEWKRDADKKDQQFLLGGTKEQATSLIETYKLQALFS